MEAILFIGVPGSGKSSFFKERYFSTHVRISMDLLKTRHREQRLLEACLSTGQPFVIDNTNVSADDRARYISFAKSAKFEVVGYYFESRIADCLARNNLRTGKPRVPDVAIVSAASRLRRPTAEEGFDRLHYVHFKGGIQFVEEWHDDV